MLTGHEYVDLDLAKDESSRINRKDALLGMATWHRPGEIPGKDSSNPSGIS